MDDNRNHRQYEQDMDQESCGVKNNEAAHPQQEQQKSYNQKRTESHIASIKLAEDSIDGRNESAYRVNHLNQSAEQGSIVVVKHELAILQHSGERPFLPVECTSVKPR